MPQAVTHVLITMIVISIFRDFYLKKHKENKKKFSLHYVLIAGIAGLLPDIDIAVYYILSFFGFAFDDVHRTFSHTLFVPIIFLLIGLILSKTRSKELGKHHLKLSNIFYAISFGTLMHLILDVIISGVIAPLYPFLTTRMGLDLVGILPEAWRQTIIASIDAVLLVLWIIYLEIKHKISDFI